MSTPDFISALTGSEIPIIGEVKSQSAAGHNLNRGRSVDHLVARYEELGLPCLSVVTGRWFGGTDALLKEARGATHLPILRKDFITRRAEVDFSIALGADAILLTANLLPPEGLNDLIGYCVRRGVTPFVEIVNRAELDIISSPSCCVVAVNNRDIRHKELSGSGILRSVNLADDIMRSGAGCTVSASGIESPSSASELLALGYQGLLVGTALMIDPSPERWSSVRRGGKEYEG